MTIHVDIQDRWVWILELVDGYTICGACHILTSEVLHRYTILSDLIWHQDVPLKVYLFV
jgi:hypothetical protein